MTSPKTTAVPILLALISTLTCASSGVAQSAKPDLDFVFDTNKVSHTRKQTAQPTILPTHKASFRLDWYHPTSTLPTPPDMATVLQTAAGKSISQLQREFVRTGGDVTSNVVKMDYGRNFLGATYYSGEMVYELNAVSRDDACKMAEAYIEVLLRENYAALKPQWDEILARIYNQQEKLKQDIADVKQKIPKKEQELKDLRVALADLKKARWYQSSDQAQRAMLELNTILNTESIELAGLLAKRTAIERHRRDVEHKIKSDTRSLITSWQPILLSLEQKYIDLMIDLDVARAREQTALKLREQAQEFLTLSDNVNQLDREVTRLPQHLQKLESDLREREKWLAQSKPSKLPLQVYKNEVRIRPLTVKFTE